MLQHTNVEELHSQAKKLFKIFHLWYAIKTKRTPTFFQVRQNKEIHFGMFGTAMNFPTKLKVSVRKQLRICL